MGAVCPSFKVVVRDKLRISFSTFSHGKKEAGVLDG